MDEYIKTLLQASGTVWTVFKKSALSGINPDLAFEQICERYKGSVAEGYVRDYVEMCKTELPRIKDPTAYMGEAQKATGEMWAVFKAHVPKLYSGEMTDGDWNRLIKSATDVGYKRWDSAIKEYAKSYSSLCVTELDRHYRRLHHIREDWYKFV